MNVIIEATNKDRKHYLQLKQKINNLKKDKFIFFYSPAHIEETVIIQKTEDNKIKAKNYIKKQLTSIIKITKNNEILPSHQEIIIKIENPNECMKRVKKDYYINTLIAEFNMKFLQAFRDEKSYQEFFFDQNNINKIEKFKSKFSEKDPLFHYLNMIKNQFFLYFEKDITDNTPLFEHIQKKYNINKKELSSLEPNVIFLKDNVLNFIENESMYNNEKYNTMKHSHLQIEKIITELLSVLEKIGYQSEGRNKSRSMMHDNTHAIYATKANYFIINDNRYRKKVKAIYNFLEIPTIVLNIEEFLNLDEKQNI